MTDRKRRVTPESSSDTDSAYSSSDFKRMKKTRFQKILKPESRPVKVIRDFDPNATAQKPGPSRTFSSSSAGINNLTSPDLNFNASNDVLTWLPQDQCQDVKLTALTTWRKMEWVDKSQPHSPTFLPNAELLDGMTSFRVTNSSASQSLQDLNLNDIIGLWRPESYKGKRLLYFINLQNDCYGNSEYSSCGIPYNEDRPDLNIKLGLGTDNLKFVSTKHSISTKVGDIKNPATVAGFISTINNLTMSMGARLLITDYNYMDSDQPSDLHLQTDKLVVAKCLLAVGIVEKGGHFVCRIRETFSTFQSGILFLMRIVFNSVGIYSSPTISNPEIYMICKGRRERAEEMSDYLKQSHSILVDFYSVYNNKKRSVCELVPFKTLQNDKRFKDTLFDHNIRNAMKIKRNGSDGQRQTSSVNSTPRDVDQLITSQVSKRATVDVDFSIFNSQTANEFDPTSLFCCKAKTLTKKLMETAIISPYDWRCVLLQQNMDCDKIGIYWANLDQDIHRFNGDYWLPVQYNFFLLPKNSLVYGEIVLELLTDGTRRETFHIIDAFKLGGQDMQGLHFVKRHDVCRSFLSKWNLTCQDNQMPVKMKFYIKLREIENMFKSLQHQRHDSRSNKVCFVNPHEKDGILMEPSGLLFIPITKLPWQIVPMNESGRKGWFNSISKKTSTSLPNAANSDFSYSYSTRMIWEWGRVTNLTISRATDRQSVDEQISANFILDFVTKKKLLLKTNKYSNEPMNQSSVRQGTSYGTITVQNEQSTEWFTVGRDCWLSPTFKSEILCEYPADGSSVCGRAIQICEQDIMRLAPYRFLNYTIVDFWLQYILRETKSEMDRNRSLVLSSLTFLEFKDNVEISKIQRDDLHLYDKELLFIPIPKSSTWLLAVVYLPGTFQNCMAPDRKPLILLFDSCSVNREWIFEKIRSFLNLQLKARRADNVPPFSTQNLPGYNVKVPVHQNPCDGGLHLIHCFEQFFNKPLQYFLSPHQLMHDIWFKENDLDGKRGRIFNEIRTLISTSFPENLHIVPPDFLVQYQFERGK